MKTVFKILVIAFLFINCGIDRVQSQSHNGLYLSAEDFNNKKIFDCDRHAKIKTHELFKKHIVQVKCKDSVYTFKKKDVFGYEDKDGQCYRFFEQETYSILNPAEKILLYKKIFGTGTKTSPVREKYYFSKDASSPIMILTLANLEQTFSSDHEFVKLIELHFNRKSDLLEFDNEHNIYKLNRLYQISKEEKIN